MTPRLVEDVLRLVPDGWLAAGSPFADAAEHRAAYAEYLAGRLAPPRDFVEEALDARA